VAELSEIYLKTNFGAVWPKFLEFEISRSKRCAKIAGSVNGYLILQIVAYHNLSLITSANSLDSYSQARAVWEADLPKSLLDLPYILNYAAIAELTGLDKETARRVVLKLERDQWLSVDKKLGINYAPSEKNQKRLLELNEWEISYLGKLIELMSAKG